jgi:16S rRNA (cytosine1402-N4)-methyltransferase
MDQDRSEADSEYHRPVLADEVARLMAPVLPGVVVDATFGGGGHSRRLLEEFGGDVTIVGIDRDPAALENAQGTSVVAIQGNFGELAHLVAPVLEEAPTAVLFDFGVSSHQLREAERGFSYHHDGPLDMRMGPDALLTADEIVNRWDETRLARILREYGEEPLA